MNSPEPKKRRKNGKPNYFETLNGKTTLRHRMRAWLSAPERIGKSWSVKEIQAGVDPDAGIWRYYKVVRKDPVIRPLRQNTIFNDGFVNRYGIPNPNKVTNTNNSKVQPEPCQVAKIGPSQGGAPVLGGVS